MSAQHTPGPWNDDWWFWVIRDLHNNPCVPDREEGFNYPGFSGDNQSNAILIAAAPDLLEALEAFVDSDNGDSIDTRYENARQAIMKARGQ